MLSRLFRKDEVYEAALDMYGDIVRQARQPVFYISMAVPDTPEARFDMITLHMFLVLRRLKDEQARTARYAQKLFDVMFQNMDHSLREMGVGDLSVGKKVRGLAEAFYGRVGVYDEALNGAEKKLLIEALARNVYGEEEIDQACISNLATYVMSVEKKLKAQPLDRLIKGIVTFPKPEQQ